MKRWISRLAFPVVLGGALALAGSAVGRLDAKAYPLALSAILACAVAAIAAAERMVPYRAAWNRNHGDSGSDLLHTVFSFSITAKAVEALLWPAGMAASAWLAGKAGTGLWPTAWPLPAQLAFSLLVSELGLYAIHRMAHEVPWLWRLHAVHHSAPRLYWLNAGRFHPLDVAVQSVPGMLPLVLLGAPAEVLFLHWTFTGVHGLLQHCNADLRLGPWNRIFSTADLHRWHHSQKPAEADRNYGKVLALFDILFRTRFLPDREVGPLGLGKPGFPGGFWGHLASPFSWKGFREAAGSPKRGMAPSNPRVNP